MTTPLANRAAYGQTYGTFGRTPYGPGISQDGLFLSPSGTLKPTNPATAYGTMKRAHTQAGRARVAEIPYGAAPVTGAIMAPTRNVQPSMYSGYGGYSGSAQTSAVLQTGAGVASTAGSMVAAAAAAGTIPVAGWIVAGGLVAAAAVLTLTDVLRKKGVSEARELARSWGKGDDFVKEFGKLAPAKLKTTERRMQKWADVVNREQRQIAARKAKGKRPKAADVKKLGQAIDKLNAAKMVWLSKTMEPEAPTLAGNAATAPNVVESRGPFGDLLVDLTTGDTPLYIAGAGVVAVALVGGGVVYKRRKGRSRKGA